MLRMHIYLHNPRVIEFVQSLPERQRSRTLEAMLFRVLVQGHEDGDFAKRVAEEVGKWLLEQGLVVTGGVEEVEPKEGQETQDEREVPRNPVTSFLQRWDDD